MKKALLSTYIVVLLSVGLSVIVKATEVINPLKPEWSDIPAIIASGSGWLRVGAVLGLFGTVLTAGFTHMTSGDNPDKQKKAMMMLRAGLIGFGILILAPVIINAVGAILGVNILVPTTT